MLDTLPFDSRTAAIGITAIVVAATAIYGQQRRLGPAADWVEVVRSALHPVLDPVVQRAVGGPGTMYKLGAEEFVGRIHRDVETVEEVLWSEGFRRNTMSAYKTLEDDRRQVGAWVYRGDSLPEDRQIDAMLFEAPGGATDIYAHGEYSSALRWLLRDPSVLSRHYRGVEYSPEEGTRYMVSLTWGQFSGGFELSDHAKTVLADLPGDK